MHDGACICRGGVGVYRTLDEVPLHFLIYVSFAASESKATSHAE